MSKVNVECSTPVSNYVEHLTPLSNNANRPNTATDYNVTNRPNAATDLLNTNGSKVDADSISIENRVHVECSTPVDKRAEYSTSFLNVTASPNAASDLITPNNSNANAELPTTSDTDATWCHTSGLLRFTTSVGPSMLSPLSHGASATNGVVVTPRNNL